MSIISRILGRFDFHRSNEDSSPEPRRFSLHGSYRYRPLIGGRSIRLIYLEPGLKDAPMECSIRHACLDENPRYVAISYAWGDPVFDHFIRIDGKHFKITETLSQALRALRATPGKEEIVPLWVDQICINQADLPEREQQVQLMRSIFADAETVYLWVGVEQTADSLVYNGINRLFKDGDFRGRPAEDVLEAFSSVAMEAGLLHDSELADVSALRSVLSPAMTAFSKRRWTLRLWIVQEMTVARKLIMRCGDTEVDSASLRYGVLSILLLSGTTEYNLYLDGEPLKIIHLIHDTLHHRVVAPDRDNPFPLIYHIFYRGAHHVADPRDRVYALLPLAKLHEDSLIKVDYSSSVVDVYRDAVLAFFNTCASHPYWTPFIFLLIPFQDEVLVAAPSWVPNFNAMAKKYPDALLTAFSKRLFAQPPNTGRNLEPTWLSGNPDVLLVKGEEVDTVSVVVLKPQYHLASVLTLVTWLRDCESLIKHVYSDQSIEYLSSVLYCVFSLGIEHKTDGTHAFTGGAKSELRNSFDDLMAFFGQRAEQWDFQDPIVGCPFIMNNSFARFTMTKFYASRCVASTVNGSVGAFPGDVKPGDRICRLVGVPFPVLLRKLDDEYYSVVGGCYVYGINYQASMPEVDMDSRTIKLR